LTALKSDDEMFHMALYDWLMCKQMPEKLLSVSQVYYQRNSYSYISNVLQGSER